jgi:hypothetical protein
LIVGLYNEAQSLNELKAAVLQFRKKSNQTTFILDVVQLETVAEAMMNGECREAQLITSGA